ncbi:hypothetical protein SCLCIDRAFT_120843 [Scleroderma citrinum Foug A]|uniref:F-box domain-containing protein n=1 Tax=Scleroderma citrinum Foug A TaxID=1036808 RepID=A0A0C3E198_9AGAM|nr:hypothetical protein SCLCIDRAFT_120843 [Scleroderma citrinum Foug A]
MISLPLLPQEILEHIAYFVATECFVGPPSCLPHLLSTCRTIHRSLSFDNNPVLYARTFKYKFDCQAAMRRLGSRMTDPGTLANELRKRCTFLKLIRKRFGARAERSAKRGGPPDLLHDLLWLAYLMMLENDGKNEQQLREYANLEGWLMEYWFDDEGSSLASRRIKQDQWPLEDEKNSIAMWLLWLFLRLDSFPQTKSGYRALTTTLKFTALAANRYAICQPSWAEFTLESRAMTSDITHFSETYSLASPTLAPAAILAYMSLAMRAERSNTIHHLPQSLSSLPTNTRRSEDWDADWQRCVNLAQSRAPPIPAYVAGSIEGVWEGHFTYTEFTSYMSLLSGGLPPVLRDCLVAQHRQTWKLREYHLLDSQDDLKVMRPLALGDALSAFFPNGTRIRELSGSLEVHELGREETLQYARSVRSGMGDPSIVDIIIIGEGHSAWGQFSLYGRIRPLDGLISLIKEYVEGDRGRWFYRGFLVGNVNGQLSGRWRDTHSPPDVFGYEGCFIMSRRGC